MKKTTKKDTTPEVTPDIPDYREQSVEIGADAIKFILSATSPDSPRAAFCHPYVCLWEGSLWLVATDSHRIHFVKILADFKINMEWTPIPIDLLLLKKIMAAKAYRAVKIYPLLIGRLFDGLGVVACDKEVYEFRHDVPGFAWEKEAEGNFPPIDKVVASAKLSSEKSPINCAMPIAFNHKYLHEAGTMSPSRRVVIHAQAPNKSAAITEVMAKDQKKLSQLPWFAIVMPMSAH